MARHRDRNPTDRSPRDERSSDMTDTESQTPGQRREEREREQVKGVETPIPPDRSRPERKPGRLPLPD
jgi:hypothetical protein